MIRLMSGQILRQFSITQERETSPRSSITRSFKAEAILVVMLSLSLVSGCSTPTPSSSSASASESSGPEPQYGLETVAILGTNDLHGALAPFTLKSREAS